MKRRVKVLRVSLIMLLLFTIAIPISGKANAAVSQVPVYRLSGADRYKTAVAISREGWTKSDYVVIATGQGDDKFADALAGSPLAYALKAPILLTTTNTLNMDTRDEIQRLGAKSAIILGGTAVISEGVEAELKNPMGLEVERICGGDRYETAVKIAQRLKTIKPFTKAFITTGMEFQYAMMVSPFASRDYMPILFTQKDTLNGDTKAAVSSLGIENVDIIGGNDIISQNAEISLKSIVSNAARVSGSDMSETNVNVAKKYAPGAKWLAIARNDVFADGLAGAAFAARTGMPIILAGKFSAGQTIAAYINSLNAEGGYIFGGINAVFDYIINVIRRGKPHLRVYGNSQGNLNNGGIAAISDDVIYYVNGAQGYKLYKINADGTGRTKLTEDRPWHINAVGSWVYYTNLSDKSKIYKIKTDGTCRTKLCDDSASDLRVVDNWIYYTKAGYSSQSNNIIYKIATDGTMRFKQNDDESMFLNCADRLIYYINISDSRKIYKMNVGDLSITKVSDVSAYNMEVFGDYIYFTTFDGENRLYKVKTDGTGLAKICDDKASNINKYGDYIYYTNESDGYSMYKIKADGTGRSKVYNGSSSIMNILPHSGGGFVYFSRDMEGLMLYKMKLDGTGLCPVN